MPCFAEVSRPLLIWALGFFSRASNVMPAQAGIHGFRRGCAEPGKSDANPTASCGA
jgi:hypothetical protein